MELTLIKDILASTLLLVVIWMVILIWAIAFGKKPPKDAAQRRKLHCLASRIALVILILLEVLGIIVSDFFRDIYGTKIVSHIIIGNSITAVILAKIAVRRRFKNYYKYLKWLGLYALTATLVVWTLMVGINVF
ncbi:MAG: hypothetical protein COW04_04480 [Deltaproteobacteria bacterium CG12_big_fil_rev_8_21_14_0_65_43_10]|nr:MAG: hypothetical protein AUK23_05520 [Deltaproteobacteria bacterium CG2_30_43_15]PIQ46027.1 MAG: hypothetical protein COW04_04480 [Deltaproteobacteria bacterium CG12_big_fil_rev_8_21_14_0_65_43_10]PIU84594.1 MAG: hypothetical protein COS67_12485 [Deltaproteobacteria bacterium CG06_land_8_20_14_3_00_44_19]PIX22100.1 MAG: hypothetical protein COZ68_13025 [Deltaproteobacteria bacterium CG_4_8_14_3_um_filter_43_13]PIZ19992.1 MAG: hypothetical protein COY50_07115 [Deltaproteobacteria bacterium C